MDKILSQLDLEEHILSYENYLSRKKPLFLEGDTHLHYKLIRELFNHQTIKQIPELINLDHSIALLQKSGVLSTSQIYAFIKIVSYFIYLKKALLSDSLSSWMSKIVVPKSVLEICEFFDDKGELKSSIDENFESINRSLHLIKEDMSIALRRAISTEKIGTYLVDRQVHLVNDQEALLLRGGFNHVLKGSVIGRSSGGFFYVAPQSLAKLKSKQSDLLDKKEELIYGYCKSISTIFAKSLFFLKFINKEFDRFDAYQARVNFAKDRDMEFILPKRSKEIKLERFLHPALSDPKPISLDFTKQVLMITGVNAGGKTMLLKSILSAVFLSRYLLPMYIDANRSIIGSFKEIFAILDDPQNVKNDISTFAGRMTQFSRLFSKHSVLVGVDEIELGTDADEAASLFKVVIEKLIERDMKIVITTHHKRLASLLATNEQVELLAALFDEKRQRPTFGFLQGTIGKSYAFETALRYGIPAVLIGEAKKVYGDDKEKLSELIQKNIDLELSMRERARRQDRELEEIKKLKINLKDDKQKYKDEFDLLKSKMSFEYTKAIKEAKEAIKARDSKEAHRHLNRAHEYKKATHKPKTIEQTLIPLKAGDDIKYIGSRGILKSIKKNQATIECDGITLRVPLDSLKRGGNAPKKSSKAKVTVLKQNANSTVALDLHGQRGEEAVENLDKFISDALINGYEELHIFHGIGTGKLAYAVREFLKIHPSIESFGDAPPNRGGFGATIVKL